MDQTTFKTQLNIIMSQLKQVERPDGSSKYVEIVKGNGALQNMKTLLIDAMMSESIEKEEIFVVISKMLSTIGFSIFDLFWSISLQRGVEPFLATIKFIKYVCLNRYYLDCNMGLYQIKYHQDESQHQNKYHMINMLMMIEHNGFEPLVVLVCDLITSPYCSFKLNEIVEMFLQTFKRLEQEEASIESLRLFAQNINFGTKIHKQDLEMSLSNHMNERIIELLTYMVKYGNYTLYLKTFDQALGRIKLGGAFIDSSIVKKLTEATKYAHKKGYVDIEKQRDFLENLIQQISRIQTFGEFVDCLIAGFVKHCTEWSVNLILRVCGHLFFTHKFRFLENYEAGLAVEREQKLVNTSHYYNNYQIEYWQNTNHRETFMYDEIVDSIDDLLNANVTKDLIKNIISFQFLPQHTLYHEKAQKMINFLVDERAKTAQIFSVYVA